MSIRHNEDLDPNEGPPFGCFVWQAILFAVILLLVPVGLFTFNWPVWLLTLLFVIDMVLLFFVSMTAVFLLRVFFADRRRGRGRTFGAARGSGAPRRITTDGAGDADNADATDRADAAVASAPDSGVVGAEVVDPSDEREEDAR